MSTSDRYQIIEEIGRGAMGIVYKGRDPKIGRDVALKCLRPELFEAQESAGRRFQQEILALGRLIHPNIVNIFDVWEEPKKGLTYIVMEYVEGYSLAEALKNEGPLSIEQVVEIGVQICAGLDFAHSKLVVHRDIKPGNILLSEDLKIAKITDFGIARLDSAALTQADRLTGTPQYMSPEQCRGESLDGRSDLFAVGTLLYGMLTQQKPFQGDSLTVIMHQVLHHTPYAPSVINEKVPEGLGAVVMQALEKDPDQRFLSGAVMADALTTAMEGSVSFPLTVDPIEDDEATETLEVTSPEDLEQKDTEPEKKETKDETFHSGYTETSPSFTEDNDKPKPAWLKPVAGAALLVLVVVSFVFMKKEPVSTPTAGLRPSAPAISEQPEPKQEVPKQEVTKQKVKETPPVKKAEKPAPVVVNVPVSSPPPVIQVEKVLGGIHFATEPSGAKILIDGKVKGLSPLALDLAEGSYELLVSKHGYHDLEASIDVPAGEKIPLQLTLLKEDAQ